MCATKVSYLFPMSAPCSSSSVLHTLVYAEVLLMDSYTNRSFGLVFQSCKCFLGGKGDVNRTNAVFIFAKLIRKQHR